MAETSIGLKSCSRSSSKAPETLETYVVLLITQRLPDGIQQLGARERFPEWCARRAASLR